jgi:lon-related putative ATP-dependent protease
VRAKELSVKTASPKKLRRANPGRYRVHARELRRVCRAAELPFRTTAELRPATRILGQEKALRALALGLQMESPGYNIFVCGAPGTGRKTTLRQLLGSARKPGEPLRDMVYVPRFDVPERPRLFMLPAGKGRELKRDVGRVFVRVARIRERTQEARRRVALAVFLRHVFPGLRARYAAFGDVVRYLRKLEQAFLDRDGELYEDDFGVQLLVSRKPNQRPPILWPTRLTFSGLFGSFERHRGDDKRPGGIPVGGIRAGALVEANGGFLVMQANEFLDIPHAWSALKNCLMSRQIDLFDADNQSLFSAPGSRPDPIPLDVKVVLIGDYHSYDSLLEGDGEFARVFKVRVDFDLEIALTRAVMSTGYPRVLARICRDEGLRHLTRGAVARVIEFAVRRAGRKSKVSVEFSAVADLLREANFWARRGGHRAITEGDVRRALSESVDRVNLLETKVAEMIAEGVILIDTAGSRVGQVNGLAVYDQGDYQFGKPSRITAETAMGHGGIINIERESGLSGRSHDKGVQIIGGFLRSRFAQARPLSLTASICFEQSYTGIDGDSASSTEIYAILSSLSGLPIRQDVAVTGSVNQKGDIQPIGSVNEKIEGFYDCVMANRPSGREGVIIPRRNVADLMLREDIVRAVREGRFTIWAIDRIEEGIEILTGLAAGRRARGGAYTGGSVFGLVDARLDAIARGMRAYPERGKDTTEFSEGGIAAKE